MVNYKHFFSILILLALVCGSCRKSDYLVETDETITDNGQGTGTVTWYANQSYVIEGFVFVNDGQTLTIEPGTVVRAKTGQAEKASALIVARGGRIIAQGTAENPIIFTVEGDDLEGSIPVESRGLWGGVILLGNAPLNVSGNEAIIEGIPITEPRGLFGGEDPNGDSGILQYVSIRHGGTNIGEGNEINGLTLGGVGSATVIDHVEIVSNADDGVEFFGGSVNIKYLAVAFCGDDAFDFDMGYQGSGQFWLAIQNSEVGNLVAELDGSPSHPSSKPYTMPVIHNLTAFGRGQEAPAGLMGFKVNAAGIFRNSIFIDQQWGVKVEYDSESVNSFNQWQNGNLEISNNTFYNVAFDTPESIFAISGDNPGGELTALWHAYFYEASNQVEDPGLIIDNGVYYPFPSDSFSGETAPPDNSWLETVNYQGAFKNVDWLLGWSLLSREGIVKQ
jgi:hypothetical protein